MRTRWTTLGCLIAGCIAAIPAAAQERVTLSGQVVDAASGQPIAAAQVEVRPRRERVLTDAHGNFRLRTTAGEHVIVASAMGYGSALTPVTLADATVELEVSLEKNPILLEGIVATVNRLERRRRAYPYPVRALETAEIATSGAGSIGQLVQSRLGVTFVACRNTSNRMRILFGDFPECVHERGTTTRAVVYIDDVRMFGVNALSMYSPEEVAVVESYRHGQMIRVYTRWYIEHAARGYQPLPM
jgi:hypothetical protein